MKEKFNEAFAAFYDRLITHAPDFVIGIVILVLAVLFARLVRKVIRNRLDMVVDDRMVINAIARTVYLVIMILGTVLFLRQVGWGDVAGGLLAGAGVSAIIVGFAFKDIGENLLAGFFLAFSRPFGLGDLIEVEGIKGVVQLMQFRSTHIRTYDGKDIYIPNAMLIKNPLTNFTRDGLLRHDFMIGLDYGDNIPKAIRIGIQTMRAYPDLAEGSGLAPFAMISEYSTSTINITFYYWINHRELKNPLYEVKNGLMDKVVGTLSAEGFSMPADILELKIYQEGKPIPLIMKDERTVNPTT